MIKPAKDSDRCGLDQLPEINFDSCEESGAANNQASAASRIQAKFQSHSDQKVVSLFEQRRLKGWWPCIVELPDKREVAGKCELELEILTEEEAQGRPAARGREEPNQNPRLDPPT